jgi:hypothetical protein
MYDFLAPVFVKEERIANDDLKSLSSSGGHIEAFRMRQKSHVLKKVAFGQVRFNTNQ